MTNSRSLSLIAASHNTSQRLTHVPEHLPIFLPSAQTARLQLSGVVEGVPQPPALPPLSFLSFPPFFSEVSRNRQQETPNASIAADIQILTTDAFSQVFHRKDIHLFGLFKGSLFNQLKFPTLERSKSTETSVNPHHTKSYRLTFAPAPTRPPLCYLFFH